MIRSLALFCWCLLISISVWAQGWKLVQTLPGPAIRVELDQLNNAYVIEPGEIVKYNKSGVELCRYSNKLIGESIHLDVSNPMKVILYAPDQMQVIALDSRLGEISDPINLFTEGYEQVTAVANSYNNHLWLYDAVQWKLIRLDPQMEVERTTLNLAQIARVDLYPESLLELNDRLFLCDVHHGVLVFDVLGNYIKTIPIEGIDKLVLNDAFLFYKNGDQLQALRLMDNQVQSVEVPMTDKADYSVSANRIAVIGKKGVNIYQATP